MGKNRRKSNTNSGRTSHDAATSTNLMNNMMAKNPMHTREQGQSSMMGMIDGMMSNMDGFVDKMDNKVAGIFGGGVNPAKAHFMSQTGTEMIPAGPAGDRDIAMMMSPSQEPAVAAPAAPVAPADEGPELPPWASKLSPEAQGALKGWMSKRQERIDRRDERRARADEFLGLDMNRRRGAGRSYDL
jgi:hypothetical protein